MKNRKAWGLVVVLGLAVMGGAGWVACTQIRPFVVARYSGRGAILPGASFRGVPLVGADLSYVDLRGADLAGANLAGVDLSHAFLQGANLTGANLRRAKLTRTVLHGANLAHADLRGADLYNAAFGGDEKYGTPLTILTGAQYDQNTRWPHPEFDPQLPKWSALLVK